MTTPPPLVYPPSFAATAGLSRADCGNLDQLTPEQRAELEAGRAYLRAINHPAAPRGGRFRPLPADFRSKLAAFGEALMARKTGIPKHYGKSI